MKSHDEYLLEYEKSRIQLHIKQLELREKETRRKSLIRIFIGTFLGLVVTGCMLFLFTTEIPSGNRDVVIALVSGLTGAFFGSVITYYFGDSDSRNDPPAEPKFSTPPAPKDKTEEDEEEEEEEPYVPEMPTSNQDFKKE